jgi:formate-dependent nitrite reductase membrane component NrfD
MQLERQETFGWLISIEIFLAGAGAGAFLFGSIYHLLGRYAEIALTAMITGMCLVMVGAVLLFAELGKKKRFYRVALNRSSWITRGSWFLSLYIIFGLAYLFIDYVAHWDIGSTPVKTIGVIAALFAVLVMSYTGFLFGAVKRVPFWNASGLSILFFFSSLYTGQAIIIIIAAFLETSLTNGIRAMVTIECILIFLQVIALGTFLGTAAYGSTIASESVHLLIKNPLFVFLVVITGLLVPLGLLVYLVVMNHAFILSLPASILLLIGGFYLRYGILKVGIRLPVSTF